MAFEFSVDSAGRLPSANVVYLDGMLKSGTILEGAVAIVKGDPQKHVTIKSVALVNSKEIEENRRERLGTGTFGDIHISLTSIGKSLKSRAVSAVRN